MGKMIHDVIGNTYKIRNAKVRFRVLGVDPYPEAEIALNWRKGLMEAAEGTLVCCPFGRNLVPTIRVKGGVVKLTKVSIGENVLTKAGEISSALGVQTAYLPIDLEKV